MAHDWGKVLKILATDPAMVAEFKAVYGGDEPRTQKNASEAIVDEVLFPKVDRPHGR